MKKQDTEEELNKKVRTHFTMKHTLQNPDSFHKNNFTVIGCPTLL